MKQEIDLLSVERGSKAAAPTREQEMRQIIEALLISSSEPLSLSKLREIIEISYPINTKELKKILDALSTAYKKERRGFQIDEIAGGYLLRTVQEASPFVERLMHNRRGDKLSRASLEVLAIVAHKQPVTRSQVESIRGVDCSGTLSSLHERGLVEVVGKLETPGRPSQYGVTKRFLKHFGLKDLQEISCL